MEKKPFTRFIPALLIVVIIGVFIFNIVNHGSIEHPGKTAYTNLCANCHGNKGEGILELVPPLTASDHAIKHFDSIPCWLKNGMFHPITVNGKVYDQYMYPVMSDEIQIANVMNYIGSEFLNRSNEINSAWVKEKLKDCK